MKAKEFFALADDEFSTNMRIQIDDITFETKDYVSNEDVENTALGDFEIEKFSENENGFTVYIKVSK
nr:MAG TPA: hypothetical protein [Caudoviricetes sp.]